MRTQVSEKKLVLPWLLLGLLLVTVACDQRAKAPETESAFVLPEAATITDFNLAQLEQGRYDMEDARGKWSLLFFGYTHCPDVCPTELFMLAEMMRGINSNTEVEIESPQVVFVSVDPQRDNLKHLQEYVAFYHPGFVGVTGEQSTIDRLCKSMGVFYERVYHRNGKQLILDESEPVPAGLENSYLINHSASIFLLNPAGKLHAIFTSPHDPNTMIRDLAAIQAGWRS
jgi:protein SCO1/2